MSITRYAASEPGSFADNTAILTTLEIKRVGADLVAGDVVILGVSRYTATADLPVSGDVTKDSGSATIGTPVLDKVADNNTGGTVHIYSCLWRIPITGAWNVLLDVAGQAGDYWAYGVIIYNPTTSLEVEDSD